MAATTPTSSVLLVWKKVGTTNETLCSGVVIRKDNVGFFILSTCHQLDDLIHPQTYDQINYNIFEVTVTFFDGITRYYGTLVAHDRFADLVVTRVVLPLQVFSSPPFSLIIPAVFTTDPVYTGQEIYTSHHPSMDSQPPLLFQKTWGKIIEPEFIVPNMPRRVHFHMPLVMSGSSGAPIFDVNSERLLALVGGGVHGTTARGAAPIRRLYAISRESVQIFLSRVTF